MLTERQNKILKLIVEKYIKEPIPVGSKVISKAINCSSATVRNDMGELERLGLLEKTHTSSGRIPSEAGYRYYVDNLMELKKMNAEDMLKLQIVFKNQQLALSDVITKSLQVISDMMNYTTVVLGSKSHENLLKQLEVIPLDDTSLTVIIVTDKGHVEHKIIRLEDVSLEEVKKTVSLINNLISGTPIDEVSSKLEFEVKPIIGNYVKQHEQLYNAFYHVFSDFTNHDLLKISRQEILRLLNVHAGDLCDIKFLDKEFVKRSVFLDDDVAVMIKNVFSDYGPRCKSHYCFKFHNLYPFCFSIKITMFVVNN